MNFILKFDINQLQTYIKLFNKKSKRTTTTLYLIILIFLNYNDDINYKISDIISKIMLTPIK